MGEGHARLFRRLSFRFPWRTRISSYLTVALQWHLIFHEILALGQTFNEYFSRLRKYRRGRTTNFILQKLVIGRNFKHSTWILTINSYCFHGDICCDSKMSEFCFSVDSFPTEFYKEHILAQIAQGSHSMQILCISISIRKWCAYNTQKSSETEN